MKLFFLIFFDIIYFPKVEDRLTAFYAGDFSFKSSLPKKK